MGDELQLPEGAVSYGRRLTQLAEEHPDEVALVFAASDGTDELLSWSELERRANGVARLLEANGLGDGQLLVIGMRNSTEHVVAIQAAWKLGACVCPLRWDLPAWERERVLDVAQPALVVADWELDGRPVVTRAAVRDATPTAETLPDRVPHPAMAVASGGATGTPKLIVTPSPGAGVPGLSAQAIGVRFPGGAEQTQLIPGPLYHTNGFAICGTSLFEGQRVVLMETFDAARAVELIERYRVSAMTMAPTMLLRIARLPGADQRDYSSINGIMQGAATCPQWVLRWWIDRVGPERVYVAYGSTERVGLTMIRGDEWLEHPGSVGRGLFTDIRVLDETGRDLPAGEIGEIFLRSQTAQGPTYRYLGAASLRQTPDGFTSIGDLGWLDDDGYLYIADRRVDMIVTGGSNVFPAEVEAALSEHSAVADVAVIGVPDEEWGQRVVAVVQAVDPGDPPAAGSLDAHCRERLATYKIPRGFEFVEQLPRTPAGKLNRSALVAARAGGPSDAPADAPAAR